MYEVLQAGILRHALTNRPIRLLEQAVSYKQHNTQHSWTDGDYFTKQFKGL